MDSTGEERTESHEQGLVLVLPPGEDAVTPLPTRFVPLADADSLADALVAGQLSERTRRAYASDLAELIGVLEAWGLRLSDITKDHLHAYRSRLAGEEVPGLVHKEKACAIATVSRKISVCRQFFAEALDRGLISLNPAARLRGFAVSAESKALGLTRTQAKELLDKIGPTSLPDLRDEAMLSLMIRTGVLRMDVIQATLGALSQRDGHTVLRIIGKRKKERMIKIPVDVVRTLEAWQEAVRPLREETATSPLFCGIAR